MAVTEFGDPRLQALFGGNDPRDTGVRPAVRLPNRGLPPAVLVAGILVFAVALFLVLNARRTHVPEPVAESAVATQFAPPPPLYIPPAPPVIVPVPVGQQKPAVLPLAQVATAPAPRIVQPQPVYAPPPVQMLPPPVQAPARSSAGTALVIDSGAGPAGAAGGAAAGASPLGASRQVSRMRASAFANRSMTVPQGFLIPAVLETAFDSTRPGFARAIVSRDVRGFDGKNILIPRGSRLIGDYRSDIAQGQNRATIVWNRLIRPDGMTITMDSPAVDTLGRGGVPASVDSHFFGRLGEALLQSTFEVGRALAGRAITGPVVVLPQGGGTAGIASAGPAMPATNYVPTLTVPPGKSISVFVAHDLDFTAVERGR